MPSLITHDAPNDQDYQKIQQNGATPNLAIDRDHKFTFLSPSLKTQEYILPNFFRLNIESTDTRQDIEQKVETYLAQKQADLDTLLQTTKPATLSENDRLVYEALKDQYP